MCHLRDINLTVIRFFLQLLIFSAALQGCATSYVDAVRNAEHLSQEAGFTPQLVKGGDFWITTYQKISDTSQPINIYIEGDGKVFANRDFISDNPTPRELMFLKLALSDPRPNVVYLARPCQYTAVELNPTCSKQYWTDYRLSEETILAMNEAINSITKNSRFNLIGFSGGGGAAVLIASKNTNVQNILTIAANLDTDAFADHHKRKLMSGSLNPIHYVDAVKNIPQLHLSGSKDTVVPPFIGKRFVDQIHTGCAKHKIISGAEHNANWNRHWQNIIQSKISCN
jgi:hypothetical protein